MRIFFYLNGSIFSIAVDWFSRIVSIALGRCRHVIFIRLKIQVEIIVSFFAFFLLDDFAGIFLINSGLRFSFSYGPTST